MMNPLPIPSWNALHPLIIHFPVALLLVAPLFVVVGAVISPPRGRAFLMSALMLMFLGTASALLAVETGLAAGQIAGSTPAIRTALAQHEDLAETTLVLFSLLTVAFAALLSFSGSFELDRRVNAALLAAFLIFYATGALFLVNTARRGGRLVHELGVRAPVATSNMALAAPDE